MAFTFIEKYPQNKKSSICIKPYFEQQKQNMGLENYGMVLFDGAFQEEPLACIEKNGVKRYVTGLNEYAPEVKALPEEERAAKVKHIRTVVAQLEKDLANNIIKEDDPEFWNKVQIMKPDNSEFFDQIKVRVSNDPVYLEPDKDPMDLIKLYAIEAGGFSIVARSLEEARKMNVPPKFYLDKLEETASTNTEVKKLRNKAGAELEKLFNKNQNKLFYVMKVVDIDSTQYKKTTPNDVLYDNANRFIDGELVERNKKKTAQAFLDACELDMETLKIKAMMKDANFYKIIAHKSDGFIYHLESSTMLGKNLQDVVEYFKNPLNEQLLADITKKVERYWMQ